MTTELSAWPANPWDFLRPLDKPPASAIRDTVSIVAMNGETRAGAINVSSAASRPMAVSLNVAGAAADMAQADLVLSEVVWTDTRELIPVADVKEARRCMVMRPCAYGSRSIRRATVEGRVSRT